jgi:hypothetical protein
MRGLDGVKLALVAGLAIGSLRSQCSKSCGYGTELDRYNGDGCLSGGLIYTCYVTLCSGHVRGCGDYTDNHNDMCDGVNFCFAQS